MKIRELFEAIIPNDIISEYTSEGCGVFAYALWQEMGEPSSARIGIISNKYQAELWSNKIPFEVTHVFLVDSQNYYDVMGKRSIREMARDFNLTDYAIEGPYQPKDFLKSFVGTSDSKPLYGTKEDIAIARNVIRKYSRVYSL